MNVYRLSEVPKTTLRLKDLLKTLVGLRTRATVMITVTIYYSKRDDAWDDAWGEVWRKPGTRCSVQGSPPSGAAWACFISPDVTSDIMREMLPSRKAHPHLDVQGLGVGWGQSCRHTD